MSLPNEIIPVGLLGTGAAEGYTIERSVRFNSSDSAHLSRTPASAGNRKTWTWAGWVKRSKLGGFQPLFSVSGGDAFRFENSPADALSLNNSGTLVLASDGVFRDTSAWYHVVCAVDTTQASNRVKLYVNGALQKQGDPYSLNEDTPFNSTVVHEIGRNPSSTSRLFDGYLADVHFIDGQALDPTSFGEFDTNGIWQPIEYTGTYGTNGFHLDFSDNSTAAALGTDTSGNSNTWTVNNISVTAGAGNDSLVDVPTNGTETDTGVGGEVRGNYCTWNPLAGTVNHTLSNGNLDGSKASVAGYAARTIVGNLGVSSGKWYWEIVTGNYVNSPGAMLGFSSSPWAPDLGNYNGANAKGWAYYVNGNKYHNGSASAYGASWTSGDVIGVALDLDNGTATFYKNGASQGTAFTGLSAGIYYPALGDGGSTQSFTSSANFGQRPFAYTAPSGFKALCTANLDAPLVTKPSEYMDVVTYTGDGNSSKSITGLGFSPDLVWIKHRSGTSSHILKTTFQTKFLHSNGTNADRGDDGDLITSLDSDGFTVNRTFLGSANDSTNGSSQTYVAWTWDAGSSTVSNTDGSITSQVRANTSAGFSIVTYTGNGVNTTQTIGHGLNVKPGLVLLKGRDQAFNWMVLHQSFTDRVGKLNTTDAFDTGYISYGAGAWNPNGITSSTFSTYPGTSNSDYPNANGLDYVAYCFAPVDGYSTSFSYTGNGNADGPFSYLGFLPKLILIKCSSTTGNWVLLDTEREGYNMDNDPLFPNLSNAEATTDLLDITSNGFKIRSTNADVNTNTATYIGYAWAESPFQFSRAR